MLLLPMIPLHRLRCFAGRGSWICQLLPRARWTISRLWAAVAAEEAAAAKGGRLRGNGNHGSANRRGGQRRFLVARRQVEAPLQWIACLWGSKVPLVREFGRDKPVAALEVVTDASPWGIGGYLASATTGEPLAWFADALTSLDVDRFQHDLGSCRGQAVWETLALLVALQLWAPLMAKLQVQLRVRSDSTAALAVALKMSSPTPNLNGLGAEIALLLEKHGVDELVLAHIPGRLNVHADVLSRLYAPDSTGDPPAALAAVKRKTAPVRDGSFYQTWATAVLRPAQQQVG
jgi:hypothetical protein